jgi:hypothetical protein
LNSIYNKYPASTCSVQGNNDNQSTPSETDILNRLEKAFNKVTIRTKETKEKCRKLDIQTVVQEKTVIDLETYIFNICFSKHTSVFQRQCLIMHQ